MAILQPAQPARDLPGGHSVSVRVNDVLALLDGWIARSVDPDRVSWFREALRAAAAAEDDTPLVRAAGLAARKLGKADLLLSDQDLRAAEAVRPGFDPTGLSVDQAARIAIVLASYRGDDQAFAERLDALCRTAELSELVAYYRGLAVFPAAAQLRARAGEGIRSGMKPVFEAVAHRNPYPREMFDESAWNQMVLKALFIGSTLAPIQGLDARANADLARALIDYARERWAAGRSINPELWHCVGPFADDRALDALERVVTQGDQAERLAAARALAACPLPRARSILERTELRASLDDNRGTEHAHR